jgi:RNA polymerase sigma factor (sigma-70 family)
MVLGVCRRVLHNEADAEDAFQATFLVLVRKASSIVPRGMVGNWLYAVARNAALKAKAMNVRRRAKESTAAASRSDALEAVSQDLQEILDEELSRLPDKYRVAVVLRDLEGRTLEEVARQLGCPCGTVASRLFRGRQMLARRLTGRGVALPGTVLTATLSPPVLLARVPTSLVVSTVKAASKLAAGGAASAAVSAKVAAVTEGVLKAMFLSKLKVVSAMLLAAVFALTSVVAWGTAPVDGEWNEDGKPGPAATSAQAGDRPAARPAGKPKAPDRWKEDSTFNVGGKGASVFSLAVSPNGKRVAVGREGKIHLWDVAKKQEEATLEHLGSVWSLAFSPDGKTLASGSKAGTVKLWNVARAEEIKTLEGHEDNVASLAFSPDGKRLVTGSFDKTIRLWDVETGKVIRTFAGHDSEVTAVAFSPNGKNLASAGGMARTIKVWDTATARELFILRGHTDLLWCLAYSPDGKTLASGSRDKTVRLWEAATGKERAVLTGHTSQINAVSFAPDGRTLASAGGTGDHTVVLWDVSAGKELQTLKEHSMTVWSLAFARKARVLATGGNDGIVHIWKVDRPEGK